MEINRINYETFFLLYLDRELNPSEMSEVEKFVNENADLQKEFSLLRQTILVPVQTVFDQKELLFRQEDKRRVIPMYWTRIAAAVAVLVLGGWLMTTQLVRKQGGGISDTDSKKNIVAVNKNSSDQKAKEANSNKAVLSDKVMNKIQPAVQQNIGITENQSPGNTKSVKSSIKPENDLSGKNNPVQPMASVNPDLQNPPSAEDPDGSNLAMRKSSAQELQPVNSQNDADLKHISALPESHSPVVLIAVTSTTGNVATSTTGNVSTSTTGNVSTSTTGNVSTSTTGNVPNVRDENAVFVENEDQTDNAISVVALNDKNKGITKLFKKLTRRTPADENARKVRLSVFQFSY